MAPLAPLMTEGVIRNATEEAIYDRSYRIRVNQGQVPALCPKIFELAGMPELGL